MEKRALRFLILTALFEVALCAYFGNYIYVSSEKTWFEAKEFCRRYYTDLAPVINQWEDDQLYQTTERIWIGLYKDDNDTWKWSDGTNASFFNWAATQQTYGRCVAKNGHGWHRMTCKTNKLSFYCFRSSLVLVKENVTWEEAMEHCRQQNTDLISTSTKVSLLRVKQATWEAQTDHLWIGLRYLADRWLWVNGHKIRQQAWRQGETPQCPALRRRCGALSLQGEHWDNLDCTDKLNFVCH